MKKHKQKLATSWHKNPYAPSPGGRRHLRRQTVEPLHANTRRLVQRLGKRERVVRGSSELEVRPSWARHPQLPQLQNLLGLNLLLTRMHPPTLTLANAFRTSSSEGAAMHISPPTDRSNAITPKDFIFLTASHSSKSNDFESGKTLLYEPRVPRTHCRNLVRLYSRNMRHFQILYCKTSKTFCSASCGRIAKNACAISALRVTSGCGRGLGSSLFRIFPKNPNSISPSLALGFDSLIPETFPRRRNFEKKCPFGHRAQGVSSD